jgi:CheY-like chemotaxis protein
MDANSELGINKASGAKSPSLHDNDIGQELRPQLNAIVEIAELLKTKSGGDENVQRILTVARDLLSKVEPRFPDATDSNAAACDVLYIEDNPVSFAAVKILLKTQRALKVLQAKCGETGIALAEVHIPKLILLDLNLPDVHGSEVIQRLQNNPATAHIPVVVISADATPSQIERLLVLGARNYLTKPFDVQPFLAVVDEVFDKGAVALTS